MSMYSRRLDAQRSQPLSPAQEQELFREYHRTRSPELARRLAEANVRLVMTIAAELDRTGGRSLPDLFQEGNVGLLQAVRHFDPNRGVRFSTYAAFWIRASVLKFLRDNARIVRPGRTRADRAAFHRGELPPADLSLETPLGGGHGRERIGDRLADGRAPADVLLETAEVAGRTTELARSWGPRERAILQERLLSDEPPPLRRLGGPFAVSGERLRQIEKHVLATLRQQLAGPEWERQAA